MLKINLPKLHISTPTIQHIWLALPLAMSFIALNLTPLKEGDLWWHIKVGEQALRTGQVPRLDEFTFTAYQAPYLFSHSWLSDVCFFIIAQAGGLAGLVLCQAVISTILVTLLLRESTRRGASPIMAALVVLFGWVGLYPYLSTRPQIFSFLLFCLFYILCDNYLRYGSNRLWLLPVLMAIWVNLHGAWIMGIILWGIYLCGALLQRWWQPEQAFSPRPLLSWGVVTLLILPLNPEGFAVYRSLLAAGSNPINQQFVSEWQPLIITNILSWAFFGLLAVWVCCLAYTSKRPRFYELILMLVYAAFGLRYLRMPPFFFILAVPMIAEAMGGIDLERLRERFGGLLSAGTNAQRANIMNGVFLFAMLLGTIGSVPYVHLALLGKSSADLISPAFPVKAIATLPISPTRIFSLPEWGGFLIWSLHPPATVFVDGRVELFSLETWDDYLQIATASDGWQKSLDQYQVDTLILSKMRQGTLIATAQQNGWIEIVEDDVAVILIRHGGDISRLQDGLSDE